MSGPEQPSVGLTAEQWVALAKQGAKVPMTIPIMGTSMLPLIRYKVDPVTILPLDREPLEGDIVLFRHAGDGDLVVHRVYRVLGDQVQTWGDNRPKPDRPVGRSEVLGLVVSMRRGDRTIPLDTDEQRRRGVRWMRSPLRRPLWRAWHSLRWLPGKLIRKLWPDFRKQQRS